MCYRGRNMAKDLATVIVFTILMVFSSALPLTDIGGNKTTSFLDVNDPEFKRQFYLNADYEQIMNIKKAWTNGFSGKGITICINDPTGVDYQNPELSSHFDRSASYNFEKESNNPLPQESVNPRNVHGHGTWMAGLAAGQANNHRCGIGVAFKANLSAVKLLQYDPRWTDEYSASVIARSFLYKNQHNDIYSCSWNVINWLQTNIGYMRPNIKSAISRSAREGRNGRGNIFVMSAGNGGIFNGSCSYDEFTSPIFTNVISLVNGDKERSVNNVRCPGIAASTFASDGFRVANPTENLMPSSDLNGQCGIKSTSTSAATAVASGIMALTLQANPKLGWRDVQHLIARTSNSNLSKFTWRQNKAGLKYNDWNGFGVLDADALTMTASKWKNVGPQIKCTINYPRTQRIDGVDTMETLINLENWSSHCPGTKAINFLEHVVVTVNLTFTFRRNIELSLQSPGPNGTKSFFLRTGRVHDKHQAIKNLSIMSRQFWGESSVGIWKMQLRNVYPTKAHSGSLYSWSVTFYGTNEDPMLNNKIYHSNTNIVGKETKNTTGNSSTAMPRSYISSTVKMNSGTKSLTQAVTGATIRGTKTLMQAATMARKTTNDFVKVSGSKKFKFRGGEIAAIVLGCSLFACVMFLGFFLKMINKRRLRSAVDPSV